MDEEWEACKNDFKAECRTNHEHVTFKDKNSCMYSS